VQDWHAVATVMREVARGLAYMHQSGRIHRDLKAANILVAPDGRVCLAGVFPCTCAQLDPLDSGGTQPSRHPLSFPLPWVSKCISNPVNWLFEEMAGRLARLEVSCTAAVDFGVSAALEATPGHDGASQSQHQPGAAAAFDAAAHMRRVSVQQQANSKVSSTAASVSWRQTARTACR
jgi:serine/threonine protein kinase